MGIIVTVAASSGLPGAGASGKAEEPLTVADLNLLHGLFCDPDNTDWCNAPARVEILGQWLEKSKCPDLVGLQEINPRLTELITDLTTQVCAGAYEVVSFPGDNIVDAQMVLSRLPVVEQGHLDIANFPWEAVWVRVDSTQGSVDFITAHFASSSNDPPCDATNCPPVCEPGISTNECHAAEIVEFFDTRPEPADLSILAGDLNARPDEPTLTTLYDADFVDTWVDAGRAECDPETGKNCTGCSELDSAFIGMETKDGLDCGSRIDFILVRSECSLRAKAAGFAHKPLKQPVDGLYWPSDHRGVQASLTCRGG
jgi:endonuclease/exonuclease/phosphatase family metal-dependent hydrolase